jgi:S1-C subfamily serine protease
MKTLFRSHFAAAVAGGLIVAGTFVALGVMGRRNTQTFIVQSPLAAQTSSSTGELTAHAIYVRDAPGVVFVRAQVIEQVQDPFDLFGPQQQSSIETGSGFLIDRHGDILTNYHVIEGANRENGVTVQFEDDVSRMAAVVGVDPNNDLALLRVDMSGVPSVRPLPLGDSESVQVGDPTLAIGNPFGLDRTLTSGIVSALQRQIPAPSGFSIDNVIQTDAPINPGNSGGPLLDAVGHVIGINSQIETAANGGSGNVGIAFAVPIDTAKEFLPNVEHGVHITIAYLGITGAPSPGPSAGVVIKTADTGGPAASAGLKDGDSIEQIDGQKVATMDQVQALVAASAPGGRMVVQVRRAGHSKTFAVKLGERPASAP